MDQKLFEMLYARVERKIKKKSFQEQKRIKTVKREQSNRVELQMKDSSELKRNQGARQKRVHPCNTGSEKAEGNKMLVKDAKQETVLLGLL